MNNIFAFVLFLSSFSIFKPVQLVCFTWWIAVEAGFRSVTVIPVGVCIPRCSHRTQASEQYEGHGSGGGHAYMYFQSSTQTQCAHQHNLPALPGSIEILSVTML
jgi:hypothetical protein